MRNKILVGLGIITGLLVLHGIFDNPQPQVAGTQIEVPTATVIPTLTPTPTPTPSPTPTPTPKPTVQPVTAPVEEPNLSNDNYYINSQGESVHSPAYTEDNSVPAGATAICGDGTYSFSRSRRGTCSHHGGVSQWL